NYGTSGVNNPNALTITSPSTTFIAPANPFSPTGTLTLSTAARFTKLVVLVESVVNNPSGGSQTMTATVTFTDATTQVFAGNSFANWFSGTAGTTAFAGFNRVNPTNGGFLNVCSGLTTSPNMFELQLPISVANQSTF